MKSAEWHHERYDGRGYPDGLKGEEIPISARVVSLADVYDALVSDRVYKKAYSHEKAIRMILNGECGVFNPLLLECLLDIEDKIRIRILGGDVLNGDQRAGKERTGRRTFRRFYGVIGGGRSFSKFMTGLSYH